MRVGIDIPVFSSPTTSFATVWGEVELPALPCVGDEVSFLFSGQESMPQPSQFGGISVVSRRFDVGRSPSCFLGLSDVVMDNDSAAEAVCCYFEQQFGFVVDRYRSD